MIEIVLCIFIFVRAIVRKEYRYTSVSVLSVLYFLILSAAQNPTNATHAENLGVMEKLLLVLLTAVLIYCARPDEEGKHHVVPAILSGIACIVRFLRSAGYARYTDMMIQPGADVTVISSEFNLYYHFLNVIALGCVFFMLVCVAWQLWKDKLHAV